MFSGFVLLGLAFGQSSGAVNSNFSDYHRYTGAAIVSNSAWFIGAGFAPLVALVPGQPPRPLVGRAVPAVGRDLHARGVGDQPRMGKARELMPLR